MSAPDEDGVIEEIIEHGRESTDPAGDARRRAEDDDQPDTTVSDAPKD